MTEYSRQDNSINHNMEDKRKLSKESIIGLGESSFRKNYYPELQEKILALEEINVRNKAIITAIPDILLVSDIEGNILPLSNQLRNNHELMTSILEDTKIITLLKECVTYVCSFRNVIQCNFEKVIEEEIKSFEIRAHISELNEVLIIIRDMTKEVLLQQRLLFMAERDALTGVFNRWRYEKELDALNNKTMEGVGLIIIDIDGLKLINDTLGHHAGDELIKTASSFIKENYEDVAMIARIGGDEFGIIIYGVTQEIIENSINRLQLKMSKYNQSDASVRLSLSFGYSLSKTGIINTKLMYQEADNNMYQNKLLKVSSNRSHIVSSLMKALEERDYVTQGHVERLGELAILMGKQLHLTAVQLDRIALLAKFHDIGKVGIPDSILKKPDKLTPEEYKIMKTHTQIGERIAKESGEMREIAHLILKHHEHWNGEGYPLQLKGEEIPIECRILAIVDSFDAMTNDRPYRKALSEEEAFEEITRHSGKQFDPILVNLFLENFS